MEEYRNQHFTEDDFTGARFTEVDFNGARFHGVDLTGVTISDAWVTDVEISGLVTGLTVNGVEVTGYIQAELDRRHPVLPLIRSEDPDDLRAAWEVLEGLAAETVERARSLPPDALDQRVAGEWSYLETLRHLVHATDRWITAPVLEEPHPFHRLGWPNDALTDVPSGLLDLDATPTLDEVLAVRQGRTARVADLIGSLDAADLNREVASPNGGTVTVLKCVHVVLREEWWHHQYANRDLSILETTW